MLKAIIFGGAAMLLAQTDPAICQGVPEMPSMESMPAIPYEQAVINTQANPVGSDLPPTAVPPNPATAGSEVRPALPADPTYQAGPYKGALTPPPLEALTKVYQVCTRTLQDNCRNPGGR